MINYNTKKIHISLVRVGDTVIHNGKKMTVCANNLTGCEFFGIKLFGDCYRLGTKPVQRVDYLPPADVFYHKSA